MIALGAMLAQFLSRGVFGGINGAIIQAFRKVEPAWHAVLTIPLILAAFSHLIEFVVQTFYDAAAGTHGKGKAILVSVIISVISAIFNLFAMRRGVLLVKDESGQSLWRDLIRMPWLALEFLSFPLVWTVKKRQRRKEQRESDQIFEEDDPEF
jgi:Ni/Fe-hydrogenase subunit HybB-like protein